MDGHQLRRIAIENKIMQAALELFKKFGFKRVSIEEVAEKAEVSKVTLYKYFTNKHTLIRKCLLVSFRNKAKEIKNQIDSGVGLQSKLESLMRSKLDMVQSFSGEMMQELLNFDPEFIEQLLAIRREAIIESFIPILEEGRATGRISSEMSNESFVVFFDVIGVGILNSPYYKEFAGRNARAFDEIQTIALSCIT